MKKFVSEEEVTNMAEFLSSNGATKISGQIMPADAHTESPYPEV